MQLEGVGPITVSGILLEILWKINDINGFEWAFFDANTTTYAGKQTRSLLLAVAGKMVNTAWIPCLTLQYLPMHNGSERKANLLVGPTSMHSFPSLTTGHDFLHS
jgi:hypothetical protein